MTKSDVIEDTALVFGQIDEPPGIGCGSACPH